MTEGTSHSGWNGQRDHLRDHSDGDSSDSWGLDPTDNSNIDYSPALVPATPSNDGSSGVIVAVGDLGSYILPEGGISDAGGGGSGSGGSIQSGPSGSGSGLTFNITYDQSTSSLPAGFVSAINYVVNYYESIFTGPSGTTVNIDVGYGDIDGQALETGALGESETFLSNYSYSQIVNALASVDPAAAASLPATQPSGLLSNPSFWVGTAEAKALGLVLQQPSSDLDGYAGFSSTYPFTYDPNNRAVANDYDFIGVVEHEFTEVMGRIDLFGATVGGGGQSFRHSYSLLDFFHYTASGVHTYTGTTTNYFSVNGGATNLDNFNSNASGDLGDWASSAGADFFLAFSPTDQVDTVSSADITEMNALGYGLASQQTGTVIEAFGATELIQVGSNYIVAPVGGGNGAELKYGGAAVVAGVGTMSGWNPIGAEATTGGYEIAWKDGGANIYTVWNTDSNGNYVSDTIGNVAGNSAALEALEPSFQQDLNGDGFIGVVTTVEACGATSLQEFSSNYYLDPVSGGVGPTLKSGGNVVVAGAGPTSGWNAIAAEATASGYEVAWQEAANLYTVWNLASNGNYVSDTIGNVSGTSGTFESLEASFQQDLNGDGFIGVVTLIQTDGSTSLVEAGSNYFLNPVGGGTGPELQYGGSPVTTGGVFSGWQPIGAVQTSSGYDVAWKDAGTDTYSVWTADAHGNFNGELAVNVVSTNHTLESLETVFNQDINGDGTIGVPGGTLIQTDGSTSLVEVGDNYFLNPAGGGTDHELQYGGSPVATGGVFSGWQPIGAVQTASGYDVAWENAGTATYSIWTTDSSGNFNGELAVNVTSTNHTFESLETVFNQDLNGDGTVGVPGGTLIQTDGSTSLVEVGNNYFLDPAGGGTGPELQYGGAPVTTGGVFSGWQPIGAVQTASGYDVAWENAGTGSYSVWTTDSSGNFTGELAVNVGSASYTLESLETVFNQDLNGDGTIGIPGGTLIQTDGSTSLVAVGNNYFLDPTAGSTGPELQYGGAPVTTGGVFSGWQPIGAVQTASGYDVAWKDAGTGTYSVWTTDSSGNFSGELAVNVASTNHALESLETVFNQDLNGDGTIGLPSAGGSATIAADVSQATTELPGSTEVSTVGVNTQPPPVHDLS